MARTKRISIKSKEYADTLINKMLEKHGVDYNYIMNNQHINGVLWCSHYDWTIEEHNDYREWYIKFHQERVTPKLSKKFIEKQFIWFNLAYGLKIKDE